MEPMVRLETFIREANIQKQHVIAVFYPQKAYKITTQPETERQITQFHWQFPLKEEIQSPNLINPDRLS